MIPEIESQQTNNLIVVFADGTSELARFAATNRDMTQENVVIPSGKPLGIVDAEARFSENYPMTSETVARIVTLLDQLTEVPENEPLPDVLFLGGNRQGKPVTSWINESFFYYLLNNSESIIQYTDDPTYLQKIISLRGRVEDEGLNIYSEKSLLPDGNRLSNSTRSNVDSLKQILEGRYKNSRKVSVITSLPQWKRVSRYAQDKDEKLLFIDSDSLESIYSLDSRQRLKRFLQQNIASLPGVERFLTARRK